MPDNTRVYSETAGGAENIFRGEQSSALRQQSNKTTLRKGKGARVLKKFQKPSAGIEFHPQPRSAGAWRDIRPTENQMHLLSSAYFNARKHPTSMAPRTFRDTNPLITVISQASEPSSKKLPTGYVSPFPPAPWDAFAESEDRQPGLQPYEEWGNKKKSPDEHINMM